MRPPYDVEFRARILAALESGLNSKQVAETFGIHFNTVRRLRRTWRETGSLADRPRLGGGTPRKLDDANRSILRELRRAEPFAPLTRLAARLEEVTGIRVSETTLHRELRALGFERIRDIPRQRVYAAQTGTPGGHRARTARNARTPAGPRRYPTDLSDEQWALLSPLIPRPKVGGRPAKHDRRTIVDAILYVTRTGCQWRALPLDFPPWSTVYDLFRQWRDAGVWERANQALRERLRRQAGRKATPGAAIVDSQSARTTEKGGPVDMTGPRS